MEFRILGPLEVLDADRPVSLPGGRARALLALLALHAGEVVSSDRLIDDLWGEGPPATAATMVHGFVSKLRKALEPARAPGTDPRILETAASGYRLAVEDDDVDANRFKRMLDQARGADPATRSAALAEALALWRGPALADFRYEPFAQRAITALEELRLEAVEDRVDADLALGRHGELVAEIEGLVAANPFRERLRGHLMLALYRAGRQAEALEAYQAARAALVDELGIEPGPALRDLEQAILRQDPALDVRPQAAAGAVSQAAPAAGHWLPRERRTVTVVFADIAVSGEPGLDPEALKRAETQALEVAASVFRRHGARIDELFGGMVVAFFGLPVAHEDDALRAVRAAVELRGEIAALDGDERAGGPGELSVRAGIDTGETVLGVGDSLRTGASGQAITAATRLHRAAADGDVLVGDTTRRLVAGAALMQPVKDAGAHGWLPAWRVLDVVAGAPAIGRSLDAPMLGRGAELTRLRTAFSSVRRRQAGYRLTVLGEAGIGKTRLVTEFAASIGSKARVITGRCPAYGEGITFRPLREALLEAAGPRGWPALRERLSEEEDGVSLAEQIAGALGLSPRPPRPDGLFPAVRRVLELLAGERPLVVVIEDLHWAEPTLLDLVEYLTDRVDGGVFLLCVARPERIEQRPAWKRAGPRAGTLILEPLPADDVRALVDDRAGGGLPEEARTRIVQTARGNPLFAEQLLAAFQDERLDAIPASLQGLLAMRLDRLGPGERDLLRCASVVGADFTEDALLALLPDRATAFLSRHLQTVERLRFVERTTPTDFRFAHALVHRAAYRSTTRLDRARLHERFANWLETESTEPQPDLHEIAGHHLEQAVVQRRAIGEADDRVAALARRAGEHLTTAGERAFGRFDVTAADNLLTRARSLLAPDHPERRRVTGLLAQAAQVLGRHRKADVLLADLLEAVRADGDAARQRSIRLERARIQIYTSREPVPLDTIRRHAEEAARSFADAGDEGEAAKAWFVLGYVHWRQGRVTAMEDAMSRSLAHADRSGQIREQLAARWILARALLLGPAPVGDCIARCRELADLDRGEHPGVLSDLAMANAMVGGFDEARELNERARTICIERLRVRRPLMFIAHSSAVVEMLAEQHAAAEPHLRGALDLALDMEEWDEAAQVAARLSTVLRALGRPEEAATHASQSANLAPADGVEAGARSRAAHARTLAEDGDLQRAESLARDAVRLVPDEMLNLRADVLVELADVLRAGDRPRAAMEACREAAALYERKGNLVSSARLRRRS